MNYAFFGTPELAAIILENLIAAGFPPKAVICNPDRPVGRKKIITPPPTKILAEGHDIPVFQPEVLSISNFQFLISKVDFFLVAAYAKIIPKEILSIPKFGTIGIHPSLLPRHRGATPIQSAILAGDSVTGVTLYGLDEKIDHGPIIAGRELKIEADENYETLAKKLAALGAELAIKTIPDYLNGKIKLQTQNEGYATYTKKFKTEDAFVDLEKDEPEVILRKIRALNPEPGVWTRQNGKRMKILEAELLRPQGAGGPTEASGLKLKKIQFEGKKPQLT